MLATLAGVRENLVGSLEFLETLFGLGVLRVGVWMVSPGEPTVSFPNFFFGGVSVYP